MLIAQNVFQGFAVAYFRLQTLIRVGLFFVAAYYAFQFRHLVYARRQQVHRYHSGAFKEAAIAAFLGLFSKELGTRNYKMSITNY